MRLEHILTKPSKLTLLRGGLIFHPTESLRLDRFGHSAILPHRAAPLSLDNLYAQLRLLAPVDGRVPAPSGRGTDILLWRDLITPSAGNQIESRQVEGRRQRGQIYLCLEAILIAKAQRANSDF